VLVFSCGGSFFFIHESTIIYKLTTCENSFCSRYYLSVFAGTVGPISPIRRFQFFQIPLRLIRPSISRSFSGSFPRRSPFVCCSHTCTFSCSHHVQAKPLYSEHSRTYILRILSYMQKGEYKTSDVGPRRRRKKSKNFCTVVSGLQCQTLPKNG